MTPEGKVLNSDYKELTNFGTDNQNQLASVLRSVNSGDQNDLKELEKIDSADEKEVESLFRPMAGTFKRSIDEKPGIAREGAIETIADLPDHGSKEKNIVNNIASDFSKNGKNNSKNWLFLQLLSRLQIWNGRKNEWDLQSANNKNVF